MQKYNGDIDAERILEHIMKRTNYGHDVRDKLARELERIVIKNS